MAEIIDSVLIPIILSKINSEAKRKLLGYEKVLSKWDERLSQIRDMTARGQILTSDQQRLWVRDLEHLVYDMEDILNDLEAESRQHQLKKESFADSTAGKVIPTSLVNFTRSKIMYDRKMFSKLDIVTSILNGLYDDRSLLDLNSSRETSNTRRGGQHVLPNIDSIIVGREVDKVELLNKLLGDHDENFSILAIVGMGGVGKTTMAKLLYSDERVKETFEVMAWYCVSGKLDVFDTSKAIFECIGGGSQNFPNLNMLQVALTEKLSNKRFLLVLDGVQKLSFKKWELLTRPFGRGVPGSRIIVTTRNTSTVTSLMNSVQVYRMKVLSYEDALSLFTQHALRQQGFDSCPTLKLYGEQLVKKCGGLPLDLVVLGKKLRPKRDVREWEELLDSLWDIEKEGEILPSLKLNFYDLPPQLKRVFAYCSLFPRGYVFDKDELVQLWMAEGFLFQPRDHKSMESLGGEFFEYLKSNVFYQHLTFEGSRHSTMHDLMYKLAKGIQPDIFYMLDDDYIWNDGLWKCRHFSFISQQLGAYRKFWRLQLDATHVRTFLAMPVRVDGCQKQFHLSDKILVKLIPKLQFLRVLSLTNYSITKIPKSIGSLKYIRYLNFSQTNIRFVPEQVCDIHNLQSLLLRGCKELHSMPKSFVKMINLRHLDIRDTPSLNKLPLGIGGLKDLRTLSRVIIDEDSRFKLSKLNGLEHLQGRLSIEGLHKVKSATKAKKANLQQKKGIDDLAMEWSHVFNKFRNEEVEYQVLEMLQPSDKLRNLEILFYAGMKFPNWVGDPSFIQLTQLRLRGCENCTCLPTLGHLKSLRKLFVESMNKVKTIDAELLGPIDHSRGSNASPSLEVLEFKDMEGWEKWSMESGDNNSCFPCLREISLVNCPNLVIQSTTSILPSLEVLHIERCYESVLRSMVGMSPSIVRLTINTIIGLTHLQGEVLLCLRNIEYLCITKCHELKYLWESESEACEILANLRHLEVESCKELESLGEKLDVELGISFKSVREVSLSNCNKPKSYNCPESIVRLVIRKCQSLKSLNFPTIHKLPPTLKNLDIDHCDSLIDGWLVDNLITSLEIGKLPNVRSFPKAFFVHLTKLIINGCDNIESIPKEAFGTPSAHCISYLEIINCENLKSFPHELLPSFTSLEELLISNCPQLTSFPCEFWPPNLSSLRIGRLKKPISNWGRQPFPASLVNLCLIGENSALDSFQEFLLPSSLTCLEINGFTYLESLSKGLDHLESLEQLVIESCPNLRDLPDARIRFLLSLKVYSSLKLQQMCRRKKGSYWQIISEIPELDV